jgi:hypothetical protein
MDRECNATSGKASPRRSGWAAALMARHLLRGTSLISAAASRMLDEHGPVRLTALAAAIGVGFAVRVALPLASATATALRNKPVQLVSMYGSGFHQH